MRFLSSLAVGAALALSPAASASAPALAQSGETAIPANPALDAALASDIRKDDRARDVYRHPAATLTFFGVQPGMTVVDYMPAGGWYSRVLIPYLGKDGTYIGLNPAIPEQMTGYWASYRGAAQTIPAEAKKWVPEGGAKVLGANADGIGDDLAGTADRFLIFREIHNIRRNGWLHDSLMAARKLLKDDGMLGVVQHRAPADAPASYTNGDKGYQREQDVIGLFSAYGFDLVARSEVNANPKDPANWPDGVWTLPPSYRGAGEDQARRAELDGIGESDRMTLLFRKRP